MKSALSWDDVVATPAYRKLSPEQRSAAQAEYFNDVVAPQVPPEHLEAARREFMADTTPETRLGAGNASRKSAPPKQRSLADQINPEQVTPEQDVGGTERPRNLGWDAVWDNVKDKLPFIGLMAHDTGLGLRALASGATALPNTLGDIAYSGINAAGRAVGMNPDLPMPSESMQRNLSRIGLPEPATASERLSQDVASGMAGAATGVGIARAAAPISKLGLTLKDIFSKNAGLQIASGGSAGGMAGIARDEGFGPMGQTVAGIMGGVAPGAIMGAEQGVIRAAQGWAQASDLAHLNRAAVDALRNKSAQFDVPLTAAELTNLGSQKSQQKSLMNRPDSTDTMTDFISGRTAKAQQAMGRVLDDISPQDSGEVAGKRVQGAAVEAIDAEHERRSAVSSPLYTAAFALTKGIPEEEMRRATRLRSRLPGGVEAKAAELAKMEGVNLAKPGNTLKGLHYLNMAIGDKISGGYAQGMAATERRSLKGLKNDLVSFMDDISAKDDAGKSMYANAREAHAAMSGSVDDVMSNLTSEVADVSNTHAQRALDVLFHPGNSGPIAVSIAKRQIAAQDPEAWNGALRTYLQNAFEEAGKSTANSAERPMQAAIFRSNMMGRTRQADILKAAMDGNQWKTFGDLMSVFEATGRVKTSGSGVAYDQIANVQLENEAAKGVVGLASKALTPFKFVQNWIKDAMVGKHAAEMAKIITSPDSIEKLRALKELPPKSDRFAVGMSSLLGISPNGKDRSSNRQEESP